MIADESESGGDRLGVGATPQPNAGQPRIRSGFRRAAKKLTLRTRKGRPSSGFRGRAGGASPTVFTRSRKPIIRKTTNVAPPKRVIMTIHIAPSAMPELAPNAALPDISGDFQSELAALQTHYAGRMAAARFGLTPAAAIKSIAAEQIAAIRDLMNRWQASTRNAALQRPSPRPSSSPDQPART